MPINTENTNATYDDGKWHAVTMGRLLHLLIDSGRDPACLVRVARKYPADEAKSYAQHIEVIMLPNGQVLDFVQDFDIDCVDVYLAEAINRKLIR